MSSPSFSSSSLRDGLPLFLGTIVPLVCNRTLALAGGSQKVDQRRRIKTRQRVIERTAID